jgi:hypothetical protein
VDLIDFSRRPDGPFKWVLRYVDHHSGFAHVDCYRTRRPSRHYPTIHIVKGCLRHPQSQGCVERGNDPFKEGLDVWISQNPGVSWAEVGAFVVNGQINGRPSWQRGGKCPYEIYYGKHTTSCANYILNKEIIMQAKSEYGLKGIQQLMEQVGKMNPYVMINTGDITMLVEQVDNLFDEEEPSVHEGGREQGVEKVNLLVEQIATSICAQSEAVSYKPVKSNVTGSTVTLGKRHLEGDNNNMAGQAPKETNQMY